MAWSKTGEGNHVNYPGAHSGNLRRRADRTSDTGMMCFFHLVNGAERVADERGLEITDLDQACQQIDELLRDVAEDWPDELQNWIGWSCEVTDANGTVLFTKSLVSP